MTICLGQRHSLPARASFTSSLIPSLPSAAQRMMPAMPKHIDHGLGGVSDERPPNEAFKDDHFHSSLFQCDGIIKKASIMGDVAVDHRSTNTGDGRRLKRKLHANHAEPVLADPSNRPCQVVPIAHQDRYSWPSPSRESSPWIPSTKTVHPVTISMAYLLRFPARPSRCCPRDGGGRCRARCGPRPTTTTSTGRRPFSSAQTSPI